MRKAAAENIKLSAVKDVTILDGQGLTGKMAGKVMARRQRRVYCRRAS